VVSALNLNLLKRVNSFKPSTSPLPLSIKPRTANPQAAQRAQKKKDLEQNIKQQALLEDKNMAVS